MLRKAASAPTVGESKESAQMQRWGWRIVLLLVGPLTVGPLLAGCGLVGNNHDVKLHVPFRTQPTGSQYCGPASILMWRLYDGLPSISQTQIANAIGATWYGGASPNQIADGVNTFTGTTDAYADIDHEDNVDDFMSREVTSIDSAIPVIAIVNHGFHAGVVDGGKWHRSSGNYAWDYVYFHDPLDLSGADTYWASGDWISYMNAGGTFEQVISSWATMNWTFNESNYANRVRLNGDPCLDTPDRPICP